MSDTLNEKEEIDGFDARSKKHVGDYPIDTVLIRTETRTVNDIMRRIDKNFYVLNPDFQRSFIWKPSKQSKLIESVLMRIPLPVFYLAENKEGKMIVVDGLQRLTTFHRYVNNEFALTLKNEGGYSQSEFDQKKFEDLDMLLQNRIEDCNLIIYIVAYGAPQQALLDIFERVNGGEPLTSQQMRNCLYTGPATRFLREAVETQEFRDTVGNSLNSDTMRDREFINRFCAFEILGLEGYKGEMDDFLGKVLDKMNDMNEAELNQLQGRFRLSMINNRIVFEKDAFRKPTPQGRSRKPINAALWDILSTGLSRYETSVVEQRAEKLREGLEQLLANQEFEKSVTYATNDTKQVQVRFNRMIQFLKEIFS